MSGAENSNANRFTFSARVIPGGVRRAQLRTTLTYRLTPRLQAGIEVNPRSTKEKANPLVNRKVLTVPKEALLKEEAKEKRQREKKRAAKKPH